MTAHKIVSFDVDSLPQAKLHTYQPSLNKPQKTDSNFLSLDYAQKPKVANAETTYYSYEDVAKHSTELDCWTVYEGKIYDVSEYAKKHPGGVRKLMLGAG